jgi:hypothetical protein
MMNKYIKNIEYNRTFFSWGLVMFALIGILQLLADFFNWYYIFPRFDTPMHVFGGLLVGFFALAYTVKNMNPFQKLLWVIVWVIIIGVGVEVFEWLVTHFFKQDFGNLLQRDVLDTYSDILHDFIGGSLAYCFAFFTKKL